MRRVSSVVAWLQQAQCYYWGTSGRGWLVIADIIIQALICKNIPKLITLETQQSPVECHAFPNLLWQRSSSRTAKELIILLYRRTGSPRFQDQLFRLIKGLQSQAENVFVHTTLGKEWQEQFHSNTGQWLQTKQAAHSFAGNSLCKSEALIPTKEILPSWPWMEHASLNLTLSSKSGSGGAGL